jgi:hypothetical protein
MTAHLDRARAFVARHARALDRARFALITGEADDPASALGALSAYAVPGGGYGRGLEPGLRSPEAQPAAAVHAFAVFEDIAPRTDPAACALCDWLARVQGPDGGLPFALPVSGPQGSAPLGPGAAPRSSSLQVTAAVTAGAHRTARHDMSVAAHPWLMLATGYCLAAMERRSGPMPALELMFSLRLLSALDPPFPRAGAQLERLGSQVPRSGRLPVRGRAGDEFVRPLDLAPGPGDAVRAFLSARAVEDDLDRLAAGQQADGGWAAGRISRSPAAARERPALSSSGAPGWRGRTWTLADRGALALHR